MQWLNNDPNAFDWTHVLKHIVVDLEGKNEEEVPIWAELVRKIIKAVVPCDANRDPPIPMQYVDQYDIVTDFLCLVSACATTEDYTAALVRLHALLKPAGKIVLYTPEYKKKTLTPVSYPVGPHNFFDLPLSKDDIFKSLEQAGYCDVRRMAKTREDLGFPDDFEPEVVAFSFITASKMNWWMNCNRKLLFNNKTQCVQCQKLWIEVLVYHYPHPICFWLELASYLWASKPTAEQ